MTAQNRFDILYSFPTQLIFQALALGVDVLLIYYFLLSFDEIIKLEGFIKTRLKANYHLFLRSALVLIMTKLFILQSLFHVVVLNLEVNNLVIFILLARAFLYLLLTTFITKLPLKYLVIVGIVWFAVPRIFIAVFW